MSEGCLIPCRFCQAQNPVLSVTPEAFFVRCRACGAQGPLKDKPCLAADAWNGDDCGQQRALRLRPIKAVAGRRKQRLTPPMVQEIKRKLMDTHHYVTYQALADEYGVHLTTISDIANRKTWKHVQ